MVLFSGSAAAPLTLGNAAPYDEGTGEEVDTLRVLLPCPSCGRPIDLLYQLALPLTGFERDETTGDIILTDRTPWFALTILCESWPDCKGSYTLTMETSELRTLVHPEMWPDDHPLAGKVLQFAVSRIKNLHRDPPPTLPTP